MCGWNCFSSLINLTFVHSFGSTSLKITGMTFLKEVGLGRAGVLVGLAVLAPGGELVSLLVISSRKLSVLLPMNHSNTEIYLLSCAAMES